MTQQEFNAAYLNHQAPEIRDLMGMDQDQVRVDRAADLAKKGFVIDVPIMAWGFDPYYTMLIRQNYGYTWVPSALQQPVTVAPGLGVPGAVQYDPKNPPAGSIKVSLDLADYPAFDPPAPPPPDHAGGESPVGGMNFGSVYFPQIWDQSSDGTMITEARGTFKKHKIATPFGFFSYWEKVG